MKDWLQANFPELRGKVTGGNYPPPPVIELLMKIVSMIQLAGIVVAVLGSNVFTLIGFRQPPSWYDSIERNGVQVAIFVYLLLPQIMSKWIVSGAFEIVMDDTNTIFSKLASGKLPGVEDLTEPLLAAGLKMASAATTTAQQ